LPRKRERERRRRSVEKKLTSAKHLGSKLEMH